MLRYAITPEVDPAGLPRLAADAERWAATNINFVQLRAKQLDAGSLATAGRALLKAMQGTGTRLLVNGRVDVAVAIGAHGVHLTAHHDELTPAQARAVFAAAGAAVPPLVSVSCHTRDDVQRARDGEADLILFAPVFEKPIGGAAAMPGVGLERLHEACIAAGEIPVLALGGVIAANAPACIAAGAQGIAGIRLFSANAA